MSTATLSLPIGKSHPCNERCDQLETGLELLTQLIKFRVRQAADGTTNDGAMVHVRAHVEQLDLLPGYGLEFAETVALLLAVAPHLKPELLDQAFLGSLESAGDYPELGGVRGKQYRGFLPTGQTLLFLLDARSIAERLDCMRLFDEDHFFTREAILWLDQTEQGEPLASGRLRLADDFLGYLVSGEHKAPRFSTDFPAQQLTTQRDWNDLILCDETRAGLEHVRLWLSNRRRVLEDWGMSRVLRPSYTCLFFGPPGSGKTFTVSLLGRLGFPVYRVDLAMVVSKFIGDTEKNLEKVFRRAENKNWILFFDEADALFSRRTGVRDAHDKYANQEVAYLLQRIEQFSGSGLVVLASNLKGNIDPAFLRRFQSVIYFPPPRADQRLEIWNKLVPDTMSVEEGVDMAELLRKHELSGGSLLNVMQYCAIRAAARGSTIIVREDIHDAIGEEYRKEGKAA